jgi:hypothetical protein
MVLELQLGVVLKVADDLQRGGKSRGDLRLTAGARLQEPLLTAVRRTDRVVQGDRVTRLVHDVAKVETDRRVAEI